jgi:hypothetical protein
MSLISSDLADALAGSAHKGAKFFLPRRAIDSSPQTVISHASDHRDASWIGKNLAAIRFLHFSVAAAGFIRLRLIRHTTIEQMTPRLKTRSPELFLCVLLDC